MLNRYSILQILIASVLIAGGGVWSGCELVNPEEEIPTYVKVDSFGIDPTQAIGTTSQKITAVWAYWNGRTIGVFDLPATIPVLAREQGELMLRPGVTFAGVSSMLVPYPFLRSDTMMLNPAPGEEFSFTPVTRYFPDSLLNTLIEDFESGNGFELVSGDTILNKVSDPSLVFEGDYSGHIQFIDQAFALYVLKTEFTAIPSREIYIELNYRCSMPFEIGITTTNSTGQNIEYYIAGFNPKEEWNKIYIGLQEFLAAYPNRPYRILLRVASETPTNGYVTLDNLKVISFK